MRAQEAGTEFDAVRDVVLHLDLHNWGYCFHHHNERFVTKLERHLLCFEMGNYATLCFVMAPQNLPWPLSLLFPKKTVTADNNQSHDPP